MMVAVLLVTLFAVAQPAAGFAAPALFRPKGISSSQAFSQHHHEPARSPRCSQSRAASKDEGDSWAPSTTEEIPSDPHDVQRLEREYYERAKQHNARKRQEDVDRLTKLRHNLRDLPMQRQCHRYRWTQTKTTFDVEIPMLKACKDEDLYLVVEKDQMQVAIKTDESFGAITVRWC
ncbi:unnamed protein product [Hapterophycus canaliculatus]